MLTNNPPMINPGKNALHVAEQILPSTCLEEKWSEIQ
jgi:hypothetical protein